MSTVGKKNAHSGIAALQQATEGSERRAIGGMMLPVVRDKGGRQCYAIRDVHLQIAKMIAVNSYFRKRTEHMSDDLETATATADKAVDNFSRSIERFIDVEKRFANDSKRVSGSVRDAAEKLAQGLARIEKAADFDRLERMVGLLERAATAMSALAEMEKSGTLERISAAIR